LGVLSSSTNFLLTLVSLRFVSSIFSQYLQYKWGNDQIEEDRFGYGDQPELSVTRHHIAIQQRLVEEWKAKHAEINQDLALIEEMIELKFPFGIWEKEHLVAMEECRQIREIYVRISDEKVREQLVAAIRGADTAAIERELEEQRAEQQRVQRLEEEAQRRSREVVRAREEAEAKQRADTNARILAEIAIREKELAAIRMKMLGSNRTDIFNAAIQRSNASLGLSDAKHRRLARRRAAREEEERRFKENTERKSRY
jgi:membrane protein involved in colicin uptake